METKLLLSSEAPRGAGSPRSSRPLREEQPSVKVLVLVFTISLTTLSALSALQALVSHISSHYTATTYEVVVGLLMVSALPCAMLQFTFDASYDTQFGLRDAAGFRLGLSCAVQSACCVALVWQALPILYASSFFIGVFTWIANGTLNSLCVAIAPKASIYQGLGFQVANLLSYGVIWSTEAGGWQLLWWVLAVFPLVGLAASYVFLNDERVVALLRDYQEPRRQLTLREDVKRMPPSIQKMFLVEALSLTVSVIAVGATSFYEDEPNYLGTSLATGLYVAFTLGNVVSRIVTIYTSIPGDEFLLGGSLLRAALTPLLFFGDDLDSAADVYLVLFFFFFALVGGVLIQIPFLLPKTKCAPEDVVLAGRFINVAQGAGLTFGGLIDVAVAVGLIYA